MLEGSGNSESDNVEAYADAPQESVPKLLPDEESATTEDLEDRLFVLKPTLWIEEMFENWSNMPFPDDRNKPKKHESQETKVMHHYLDYLRRKKKRGTTNPFLSHTEMQQAFQLLENTSAADHPHRTMLSATNGIGS